jgi:cob(I)alamin adenosyltransferase
MKIYTKTGDEGQTSLYGGERRSKSNPRIEAYGQVDELQAELGVVLAHCSDEVFQDLKVVLETIQYQGFVVCSQLANPADPSGKDPFVQQKDIAWLEGEIDRYQKDLPELRAFIMQGGSLVGASLHVARTVCRRAERAVVVLSQEESVDPLCLKYLNRLSDLLFVLARVANHRLKQPESEWKWKM